MGASQQFDGRGGVGLGGVGLESRNTVQIDMLVPGLLGKRDDYGQRYCGGKQIFIARGVYDWRNSSNLAELNAVLQKHLLIRRLKKNVLQDLPAKLRQRIPIEVDPQCVGVRAFILVWNVDVTSTDWVQQCLQGLSSSPKSGVAL